MEDNQKNKKEEILKILTPEWKDQKTRWGHSVHTMCTYMASFPASIPRYFIELFTKEEDLVFDPFSGKGTTPTEAIICNRKGYGNDLNPLAYVLTSAKLNMPTKENAFSRIDQLREEWEKGKDKIDISKEEDKIKMIFHDKTLNQLIFLKEKINWKDEKISKEDMFIIGNIMGIIHGGSKGFLSISMPNTFSMSPGYIKKYIEQKGLVKEERDVFNILKEKIDRLLKNGSIYSKGKSYFGDAREIKNLEDNSVKLIVSSPPYMKVVKYGMYNWIRLWFLNEEPKEVDKKLDDTHALPEYLKFMDEVLKEMYRIMDNKGMAVFVIGDVHKVGKDPVNLAQEVWNYSGEKQGFNLLTIMDDHIHDNQKLTKLWNEKRGKATPTDKLLIIYKGECPDLIKKEVNWDEKFC